MNDDLPSTPSLPYSKLQDWNDDLIVLRPYALSIPGKQEEPLSKLKISKFIFNLVSYIVGVGVFALPYGFYVAGIVPALLLLFILGISTIFSYILLIWGAKLTKTYSLPGLGREACGQRFCTFVRIIMFLNSIGILTAYLLLIGDCIEHFVVDTQINKRGVDKPSLIAVISLIVLLPFSILFEMRQLYVFNFFTSMLSFLPLPFLVVFLVVYLFHNGVARITTVSSNFMLAVPIIVFSFSNQQSLFPVYHQMRKKGGTTNDLNRISYVSIAIAFFLYVCIGILGDLCYESDRGNLLNTLSSNNSAEALVLATVVSAIVSFPLTLYPCRHTLDTILFGGENSTKLRLIVEIFFILLFAYGITLAIPDFGTIIGIFGSTTSISLGYVFPAIFYIKLSTRMFSRDPYQWGAWALIILGISASIAGLVWVICDYIRNGDRSFS